MSVTKFQGQTAIDVGHDVAGVENSFSEILDDLQHLEQRLELIIDSDVSDVKREIDDLILSMMDSRDDEDVTEDDWNEIQAEARDLLEKLQKAMRAELGVKSATRKRQRPRLLSNDGNKRSLS